MAVCDNEQKAQGLRLEPEASQARPDRSGDAHSVCNNLNLCKALYSSSVWNVDYVAEGRLNNTGGAFLAHTIFIFFCNLFCCLLN